MWRPSNWENKYVSFWDDELPDSSAHSAQLGFEAGADAMLKALCTKDNYMEWHDSMGNEPFHKVGGWLIFIPREDKND